MKCAGRPEPLSGDGEARTGQRALKRAMRPVRFVGPLMDA